ncbi:MAG: UDP-N-acetylmuramoyl-L-alanine--D-glutamate ligase [Pseudomonadota bacterium]
MIPAATFAGKTVAVFGLGRSGQGTCRALAAGGATVAAWDDGEPARQAAAAAGIPLADLAQADWSAFDALLLAPGVPLTHPEPHWTVNRATAASVPIIGDTEIFFRELAARAPDKPVIAITGTNGKSTTTALTGHLLREAGLTVAVGGNIGTAVLALDDFDAADVYVLEMSSYQIDLTPGLAPSIGILLNVTPDHIERHGTFERYAAIKSRLVEAARTSIICVDDGPCQAAAEAARARGRDVITLSTAGRPAMIDADAGGFTVPGGVDVQDGPQAHVFALADCQTLLGLHNAQNAVAAVVAALAIGVRDRPALQAGLRSFPGLAHRMEPVAERGGTLFFNDSKATNADSADKALAAFDGGIFWIAGGRAKAGGASPLAPHFGKIAHAYLIGESAEAFARDIAGRCPVTISGTLERAVADAAAAAAQSGTDAPVVLLSPAAASFDQFPNFEQRGDAFVAHVLGLPGVTPLGRATAFGKRGAGA